MIEKELKCGTNALSGAKASLPPGLALLYKVIGLRMPYCAIARELSHEALTGWGFGNVSVTEGKSCKILHSVFICPELECLFLTLLRRGNMQHFLKLKCDLVKSLQNYCNLKDERPHLAVVLNALKTIFSLSTLLRIDNTISDESLKADYIVWEILVKQLLAANELKAFEVHGLNLLNDRDGFHDAKPRNISIHEVLLHDCRYGC